MRLRWCVCLGSFCTAALAQTTIGVGGGAPNPTIGQEFVNTFNSNGFNLIVALPPLGAVSKYGATGLIQQFKGAANSSDLFALVKPDTSNVDNVTQVLAPMFSYYNGVGPSTAGYPTTNTLTCPPAPGVSVNSCQWQVFSLNYALFAYRTPLPSGDQNLATRDPYFTKWISLGGINGPGPANSAETAVTSIFGTQATAQNFSQGAIYNITSGILLGRLLAVKQPVFSLYLANGAAAGSLGLPVTEELNLANGMRRQTFEGGAIDYDPATGIPVLRPPIGALALQPNGSVHMNQGDTLPAQVTVYTKDGHVVTDRAVSWNTSNGRVVQIQANGLAATIKAVGAGTATVTVTAESKTSLPLMISVTALCCQIGEGAPTAALQQAFQDAVARNRLSVQLPAASAASRAGAGYVQQLLSTDAKPVPYLVAVADGASAGYVIAGAILTQYLALGGPAGSLGYPLSDATSGGRQTFQQGTLAGNPVQLVTGAVLAKWGAIGYEAGVAGSPTASPTNFLSFRATAGTMQTFQKALILAASSGPISGRTFLVTGLILARYVSIAGPNGDLGAPTGDELTINGRRHQDFEGGYADYASGDTAANVTLGARQPLVTATPNSVLSGARVRLAVGGFDAGATVRVSQTGQADFLLTVPSGAYVWDAYVPPEAASGTVTIRAADVNGTGAAQGSYTIRNAASAPLTISAASGDKQTGAPGAQLDQPLVVMVKDQFGNPVAGQTVVFAASPGAQIAPASAITDPNGQASASLRMPTSEGVALVTAQAGRQVVTLSARSAAFSLANFPAVTQGASGALAASVASIVRYHQARGELPQPNGLADPLALTQFLKSFCQPDSQGHQICDGFVSQTVNLWRVGAFTGGGIDVSVERADTNAVRDLVAGGSPVLLALTGPLGANFAVATGIASSGSLVLADPNPAATSQATLIGAARLLPRAPASPGFLVASTAPAAVASVAGVCGQTLQFAGAAGSLYYRACDGSASLYELDVAAQGAYDGTFTDLGPVASQTSVAGSGAASFKVSRVNTQWNVSALDVSLTPGGVVNAASLTADFAPGGLVSIYGAGFGGSAAVQVNGAPAAVLATFPFQVNAQIPPDAVSGTATLSVASANGSAQQTIVVHDVAPAIFSTAPGQAAIANQDTLLNTPSNPAVRGSEIVIYGTSFGAVSSAGDLSPAVMPASAVIGGVEIPAEFAGLTPGSIGLYQANVILPTTLPPGLFLPLYIKQGTATSNTVTVAVQ
jgi:uncharacterized protein (TIGR03437 family)